MPHTIKPETLTAALRTIVAVIVVDSRDEPFAIEEAIYSHGIKTVEQSALEDLAQDQIELALKFRDQGGDQFDVKGPPLDECDCCGRVSQYADDGCRCADPLKADARIE